MPCLCFSASVPSSRSFLETSSVLQVFAFNSIFNAYLLFSVCYYPVHSLSLLSPISKEMGAAYAQAGDLNTPVHLAPAHSAHITSFSSTSLSLIHFAPSFLPRRRSSYGLACVRALLAFGCSARTSILRAQRLDCLGWHLCTHSYDF